MGRGAQRQPVSSLAIRLNGSILNFFLSRSELQPNGQILSTSVRRFLSYPPVYQSPVPWPGLRHLCHLTLPYLAHRPSRHVNILEEQGRGSAAQPQQPYLYPLWDVSHRAHLRHLSHSLVLARAAPRITDQRVLPHAESFSAVTGHLVFFLFLTDTVA